MIYDHVHDVCARLAHVTSAYDRILQTPPPTLLLLCSKAFKDNCRLPWHLASQMLLLIEMLLKMTHEYHTAETSPNCREREREFLPTQKLVPRLASSVTLAVRADARDVI